MSETKSKQATTDMTTGSPAKLICLFALPLLAGNVLQQLYNMVDSIVVGNFVGDAALAAVGTGFPVIFMLVSLFMGLGAGATVMISQFYGAVAADERARRRLWYGSGLCDGGIRRRGGKHGV